MDLVQARLPVNTAPRQLHIPQLREESRRLFAALNRSLADESKANAALAAVRVQCEQCGTRLNPAELTALATSAAPALANSPRLARLHQGYCARNDCKSYYYRIEFPPTEGIDWNSALAASPDPEPEPIPSEAAAAPKPRLIPLTGPLAAKLGATLALILTLILLRQWYVGGTIPLLRQPESFQVDPRSLPAAPP